MSDLFWTRIGSTPNQKWVDIERLRQSRLPLVMYGAGANAVLNGRFLREQSITVDAVCVTDEEHRDGAADFDGLPVMTLREVDKSFDEFNCIIGFADIVAAKRNLERLAGVKETFVIENPGIVEDIDFMYLEERRDEFEAAYRLLADRPSRNAFVDFLNVRISGKPLFAGVAAGPQYFCDILPLERNEIFVDCGAYDGDTLFCFLDRTGGFYDRIYAFEPDPNNCRRLERNIAQRGLEKIEVLQKGVWNEKKTLAFSSPVSTASRIAQDGSWSIEVDSIDNILGDSKATIIKMDIEGAELTALNGARSVIAREKPKLAISVYHKAEDLVTIPFFLSGLLPKHNFYLRRHSCFSLETVLYAVPA